MPQVSTSFCTRFTPDKSNSFYCSFVYQIVQELDENATADDYARLLQQAADASAKQAQFLQMFLM